MIPEDIINEIKYRNDIDTAVSQYVNLKRRGKNLVGLARFTVKKRLPLPFTPKTARFTASAAEWAGMSSPLRALLKILIIWSR